MGELATLPDIARALVPLCVDFVLDQATGGIAGMDTRDALLVMAINQANIAPLTRDPDARLRYGGLESPAPDEERRPAPLSGIAASLKLPYETVRRRARRLEAEGICELTPLGPIVPEAFLTSPAYLTSVVKAHRRLYAFWRDLTAAGLLQPLPGSQFPPEPTIPIRASLRPLSDYLLRFVDGLAPTTSDLVSGLVFLGMLNAGARLPPAEISIGDLTLRLGMPHETVRRHAAELASLGLCERAGRRFVVDEAILASPGMTRLFSDNATNVQRLFVTLAQRGVVEAWERLGPPA